MPTSPLFSPTDDELPTLDDGGDDENGIPGDGDALTPTPDDDASSEFDDESPTDPSFDFDLPSDLGAPADDTPHELPLGPDFVPTEDEPESSDDAAGFDNAVEPADLTSESDPREHDAGEGFDDGHSRLEEELPRLDGDEGSDLDESSFGARLESADETALPVAARPWHVDFLAPDREHCGALTAERGVVVAGSSDLFWLDEGRETVVRIGLDGTRISSIALVGGAQLSALCVTAFGRLLRRARSGGDVERLVDWRRVAEASGASPEGLELRAFGPTRPSSVLGRLTSGRLVRSDDMGTSFTMLEPAVTALTMSSTGEPVAVITRDGARLGLSANGGFLWEYLELVSPAREVASGEAPLVAANGGVVVLGDAERGVVVSSDHGRTFRRVTGATNVTAVSAGADGERATAFVALYRETDDQSLLVEIDASTGVATTLAVVALPALEDPDVAPELARVERLIWDGERLWAAGAFGLARIQRDDGTD
ncbi:MAG TPA: hypothetical protein VMS65_09250 [Polyangiaceae bacterium]|nr:hypothetical protein [Polyangiaceae bacterium]